MKGVTEMRVTHLQMLSIVRLWLHKELVRGYGSNFVPVPISVVQNTITKEFIIKLEDSTIASSP